MGSATLGAGALVAASPLLLGEADEIPTAAWVLGGAGVAVGLTGIAFSVFGSHCGPRAGEPCDGIFDDALFGPLVALHALPLLAVPATYALRLWGRAGDLEVRVEGSLVSLRGSF